MSAKDSPRRCNLIRRVHLTVCAGGLLPSAQTDYVIAMAKVNLSISVKDEQLPRFSEVVKQLKKTGLQVEQTLESVGVVTGSIESEKIPDIRKIAGVSNVDESRDVQIAPPDSEVQ